MPSLVSPLESAKFIMANAQHVCICQDGVETLAHMIFKSLNDTECNYFNWKSFDLNPKTMDDAAINWIFLIDTLNFSFWSMPNQEEKYQIEYKSKVYSGYWALCAAVDRALDEGIPITDSKYFVSITEDQLRYVFRSDTSLEMPLLDQRLRILHETGKILNEKFNGTFKTCIEMANRSALSLLEIIVDNFPSYKDEGVFMDRKVTFYKRAQILVADLWACFEGQSYGTFPDINEITMFADYRVPQTLRFYRSIDYSPELTEFLTANKIMCPGDLFEIEIRAASILACRQITDSVRKLINESSNKSLIINDIFVDFFLWNYRVDNATQVDAHTPFHKLRSIFY